MTLLETVILIGGSALVYANAGALKRSYNRSRWWAKLTVWSIIFFIGAVFFVALLPDSVFKQPLHPKDEEFEKLLELALKKRNTKIRLEEIATNEFVGFAWDDACRSNALKYPEPVYSESEWNLNFRQYFGDKENHSRRQSTAILINPLKFGNGRSNSGNDVWCVERSHAVLHLAGTKILLIDERELENKGQSYGRPWWKDEWNALQYKE